MRSEGLRYLVCVCVCVCVCCVIFKEGEGNRIGERQGWEDFVNITRAASQHSCSPILGTHHAPASVHRRVFF